MPERVAPMGSLVFSSPFLLSALVLLPGLWWLLRLLPPRPQKVLFPPLELLIDSKRDQAEPRRTPLWILLLRISLAALFIIAMAGPILVSQVASVSGPSPLLIILDQGWSSAAEWKERTVFVNTLIDEADRQQSPVALVATGQNNSQIEPLTPQNARNKLSSLAPVAFNAPWEKHEKAIAEFLNRFPDAQTVLIPESATLFDEQKRDIKIFAGKPLTLVASPYAPFALAGSTHDAKGLTLRVIRSTKGTEQKGRILAYETQARLIGETSFTFDTASTETSAQLSLPTELLNRITRLSIEGERTAGATWLIGSDGRRPRVGLVGSTESETKNRLADPSWYIKQALTPYVDLFNPRMGQSEAIASLIESKVDVLILGETTQLSPEALRKLAAYCERGGTLIRFAGNLSPDREDTLWPVRLRADGRALGGALDWQSPRQLAPFPEASPFFGLDIPADVTIKRQWLAEPSSDLNKSSWAKLDDGTPLVTNSVKGRGRIILFHIASDPTWSTLPVSGLFVDMLKRIATQSLITQNESSPSQNKTPQAPFSSLDGYGTLGAPPNDAEPITPNKLMRSGALHPAGFYGSKDALYALNVLNEKDRLIKQTYELSSQQKITSLKATPSQSLVPALLLAAFVLFLIDTLFTFRNVNLKSSRQSAFPALFLIVTLCISWTEARSDTEPLSPKDRDGALSTRLAYVITGDAALDEISREGLQGLSLFLQDHTAIEPEAPMGIDLETDTLSLYPLIYWPMPSTGQGPTQAALARLETYMRNGGLLIFDTRDAVSNFNAAPSAETLFLQSLLSGLSVPPLEELPANHVLMRSFYLLQMMPGRYGTGKTWVEALPPESDQTDVPARASDGVSPLIITSNDWASAWAIDQSGRALYPIETAIPRQREMALRAGVNLVVYSLTGNYKADQIHVPALLERLGR